MLTTVLFLSVVANRLIDALVTPLFDRYMWDTLYLKYISWIVGSFLVALSGINLFADYVPQPLVGLILTAVVCGGGANFISDIFDK